MKTDKPIPVMCSAVHLKMVREPSDIRCALMRLVDDNGDCRAIVPMKGDRILELISLLTEARNELVGN